MNDIICKTPMEIAETSYSTGNCLSARLNWANEAKAGNPAAQNNMGLIWEHGCEVPEAPDVSIKQSHEEAYNWFMLAATNGSPEGAFNLGRFHENGSGVELDVEKAVSWYTLAARRGSDDARARLVQLNRAVPPDDLLSTRTVPQLTEKPTPWRDLGEWIIAFAGAYAIASSEAYRETKVPPRINIDFRATCRTRVTGDLIRTDCQ